MGSWRGRKNCSVARARAPPEANLPKAGGESPKLVTPACAACAHHISKTHKTQGIYENSWPWDTSSRPRLQKQNWEPQQKLRAPGDIARKDNCPGVAVSSGPAGASSCPRSFTGNTGPAGTIPRVRKWGPRPCSLILFSPTTEFFADQKALGSLADFELASWPKIQLTKTSKTQASQKLIKPISRPRWDQEKLVLLGSAAFCK